MANMAASNQKNTVQRNQNRNTGQTDWMMILDDILAGFIRHFPLVVLLCSLTASIVFFTVRARYVTKYQTSETYIVTPNYSVNYNSSSYERAALTQLIRSFPYVISNNAMQGLIAQDLGTDNVPGTITASSVENTNAFTITVTAQTAQNAQRILQSVMENYPVIAKDIIGDTTLSLLSSSGMPTRPINANSGRRSAMMGVLAVLALFAGGFYLSSTLRKTVRREEDFKSALNVKCIGSVPKATFRKKKGSNDRRIRMDNKRISYTFKESIRTLRTRVERIQKEKGAKVFLVSSAIAGEGKSTISVNLALSLASKGSKVILMDMDFRNASVLPILGLENPDKGLTDVIEGKAKLSDIAMGYEKTGLVVFPAGKSRNTRSILSNPRLESLFQRSRKVADYIIVDTPPSSILSDTSELVSYADQGIFVVRQDYAPMNRVVEGIDLLYDSGLEMAGCILNYVEPGVASRFGYGYGYGYGYGRYGRYGRYDRRYGRYYGRGNAVDLSAEDEPQTTQNT